MVNVTNGRTCCRLRDNENAYDRYKIRPRVLRNVSNLDPTTKIFGTAVSFPLALSPLAMQGLAHPDGEVATSRAAASVNVPMGLSTYATSRLEDVIAAGNGNAYAMQLSLLKNKDAMTRMIQRAESVYIKSPASSSAHKLKLIDRCGLQGPVGDLGLRSTGSSTE
jgi:(S)-2-hydroxy-acid oxidase